LGFSKRDHLIKKEEEDGLIQYLVVSNDKSRESMKFLIDLKNIFSKQLPRMPKEYIVRLMFNPNHQSMVILKNKKEIVGGICYRIFQEQSFAEVVFLAISPTQQIKGYGTRLMNKYKERMQQQKIRVLLTYADNSAIGIDFL
jgi:histone acetyltransferase